MFPKLLHSHNRNSSRQNRRLANASSIPSSTGVLCKGEGDGKVQGGEVRRTAVNEELN